MSKDYGPREPVEGYPSSEAAEGHPTIQPGDLLHVGFPAPRSRPARPAGVDHLVLVESIGPTNMEQFNCYDFVQKQRVVYYAENVIHVYKQTPAVQRVTSMLRGSASVSPPAEVERTSRLLERTLNNPDDDTPSAY